LKKHTFFLNLCEKCRKGKKGIGKGRVDEGTLTWKKGKITVVISSKRGMLPAFTSEYAGLVRKRGGEDYNLTGLGQIRKGGREKPFWIQNGAGTRQWLRQLKRREYLPLPFLRAEDVPSKQGRRGRSAEGKREKNAYI